MTVNKKVALIIVEGPSDKTALEYFLEKIFSNSSVRFYITYGDITTRSGVNPSNVIGEVGGIVNNIIKCEPALKDKNDFERIIHIVDTDGTYVPDSFFEEMPNAKGFIYSLNKIYVPNREDGITRNKRKRENLNRLVGCEKISNIPYGVFYMSSNLDHVLYNKMNSNDRDKRNDSIRFLLKYKDNIQGFKDFIGNSTFSVNDAYQDSWAYIKQNNNSIERHVNLALSWQE